MTDGTWIRQGNLRGPKGEDGRNGAKGDPGGAGKDGAPGLDGRSIYLAEVSGGDTWLGVEEIDTGGRSIHVGDSILSPEGDVYAVIEVGDSVIHVGEKIMSLAGPEGPQGIPGPAGSATNSRNARVIAEWRSNFRYILATEASWTFTVPPIGAGSWYRLEMGAIVSGVYTLWASIGTSTTPLIQHRITSSGQTGFETCTTSKDFFLPTGTMTLELKSIGDQGKFSFDTVGGRWYDTGGTGGGLPSQFSRYMTLYAL